MKKWLVSTAGVYVLGGVLAFFTGCTPMAYQQGVTDGAHLSQMQQQNARLEQRVVDLEKQLASRQASTPASQPSAPTWRQRFNAIPRGSTYSAVVQAVGQPGHITRSGNRALYVYYVSDQEIYGLFFESGVYTEGVVDTYENWMKVTNQATNNGHRY